MKFLRRDRAGICLTIPLPEFDAQLLVPRDITEQEAERLSAVLRTLPYPRPSVVQRADE